MTEIQNLVLYPRDRLLPCLSVLYRVYSAVRFHMPVYYKVTNHTLYSPRSRTPQRLNSKSPRGHVYCLARYLP